MPILPVAQATTPGNGPSGTASAAMVLTAVQLVHADGNTETAYVQLPATPAPAKAPAHQKIHSHMIIIYLAVGTLALSLSAYGTIKMLSKNKN